MDDSYVAGLFDGEGCVQVEESSVKGYKPSLFYTLSLANTYLPVLEDIQKKYGGSIYQDKGANKPVYKWRIGSYQAVAFAEQILPYSVVKRDQLEHFLWMRRTLRKGSKHDPLTDKERQERHEAVLALKALRT